MSRSSRAKMIVHFCRVTADGWEGRGHCWGRAKVRDFRVDDRVLAARGWRLGSSPQAREHIDRAAVDSMERRPRKCVCIAGYGSVGPAQTRQHEVMLMATMT